MGKKKEATIKPSGLAFRLRVLSVEWLGIVQGIWLGVTFCIAN